MVMWCVDCVSGCCIDHIPNPPKVSPPEIPWVELTPLYPELPDETVYIKTSDWLRWARQKYQP